MGKPQFATDGTGTVIWDAGAQVTPFGDGINLAAAFTQNLQFPGQYADKETGLSHNHHRTYDPALGRYLQSDPIGLAGGLNRYAYVGGNPMGAIDPLGLSEVLNRPSTTIARALTTARNAASADGPLPFGDAFALGYLIGAAGVVALDYAYYQVLANQTDDCDAANDNPSEQECRKVKQQCIEGCSDFVLGKPRGRRIGIDGHDFNRCVRQCMDRNGC